MKLRVLRKSPPSPNQLNSGAINVVYMQPEKIHVITALAKQEKRPWRTSIFVNGRFWRAYNSEIIVELGLHEGQHLTLEELDELVHSLERRRAIDRAILLLSYRSRSIHEMHDRLKKAGFESDIIDEAVAKLKDLGYLDDDAFTQAWAKNRMDSKLYGPKRIKQELHLKGVPDEIISKKLEENGMLENEYERALQLAKSKLPYYKNLNKTQFFRRLSQFLLRRGYASSVVYDVCKKVTNNM